MPRVDELIDRLGNARYISTLDLTKGYWQVALAPEAREKLAFAMPTGLYHYTVLPFGLHGAPPTFQRLMDRVLRLHSEYTALYLYDMIVYNHNWESYLKQLNNVLEALRRAGLNTNAKKCRLRLEEAVYLGLPLEGAMSNCKRRKFKPSLR